MRVHDSVAKERDAQGRRVPDSSTVWRAWHLYLGSSARSLQARVISNVVAPTVGEAEGCPWFFIRFWQGGPHVRLRIGDLDETAGERLEAALIKRLKDAGAPASGEQPIDSAAYRREAAFFAAAETGENSEVEELRRPGVYRECYEPEPARYGGPQHMAAAEQLFQVSSELVMAFLAGPQAGGWSRERLAVEATAVVAQELGDGAFPVRGLEAWRGMLASMGCPRERLDAMCRVTRRRPGSQVAATAGRPSAAGTRPMLRSWRNRLSAVIGELSEASGTPAGPVLFSHVHMLHNRLGLGMVEELRTYALLVAASSQRDSD